MGYYKWNSQDNLAVSDPVHLVGEFGKVEEGIKDAGTH